MDSRSLQGHTLPLTTCPYLLTVLSAQDLLLPPMTVPSSFVTRSKGTQRKEALTGSAFSHPSGSFPLDELLEGGSLGGVLLLVRRQGGIPLGLQLGTLSDLLVGVAATQNRNPQRKRENTVDYENT